MLCHKCGAIPSKPASKRPLIDTAFDDVPDCHRIILLGNGFLAWDVGWFVGLVRTGTHADSSGAEDGGGTQGSRRRTTRVPVPRSPVLPVAILAWHLRTR